MLKACFIGAGGRARHAHYPSVVRLDAVEVVGICELDAERLELANVVAMALSAVVTGLIRLVTFQAHGLLKRLEIARKIMGVERFEAFGISLDMSALPIYERFPNIIYHGKSPERDRALR